MNENNIMQVSAGYGKQFYGPVNIEIGKKYMVRPINPRVTKNRDRECIVVDFIPRTKDEPDDIVAKVRYLDNNRVGRTDFSNLILSALEMQNQ